MNDMTEPDLLAVAAPAAPAEPPPFEPGVFHDMSAEQYHAIEAMSASGAKEMRRSPMHYRYWRQNPAEPTPALVLGTAIHAAILEPHKFESEIAVAPTVDKRTNAGKAAWAAFLAESAGKLVLAAEQHATALRCRDAVHRHPGARRLLEGARPEVSMFWRLRVQLGADEYAEIPCKARVDALRVDGGMVDVKSTADASAEEFGRAIATYEYHAQGRHYSIGAEHLFDRTPPFFAFIAVEKEPPHGVACYVLQANALLAGEMLMNRAYTRYARALATGYYPGYSDLIEPATLPQYALRAAV